MLRLIKLNKQLSKQKLFCEQSKATFENFRYFKFYSQTPKDSIKKLERTIENYYISDNYS